MHLHSLLIFKRKVDISSNSPLAIKFEIGGERSGPMIPLTRRGGFRQDTFQLVLNIANNQPLSSVRKTQFVSTGSLTVGELVSSWGDIVLTPEEDRVVTALKSLDPKIERIATSNPSVFHHISGRGGFLVKIEGMARPVPIGSFGDGMWRLLALAIGIGRAKDGVLFVDEIGHWASLFCHE